MESFRAGNFPFSRPGISIPLLVLVPPTLPSIFFLSRSPLNSTISLPLILRFFSWPQPTDRPTNLPTNFSSPLHIDLETTDGPRRCFPLFPLPLYLAFIFPLFYCAANRTSRRAQRQWSKSKRGESRLVVRHRGIEEREGRRDSFSWFQHWRATLVSGTEERGTDIGAFDGR